MRWFSSKTFIAAAALWLPFAAVLVVTALLTYVAVQQDLRLTANDPQVRMAEDAAAALEAGGSTADFMPASPVDMSVSLSPYLVVFDGDGQLTDSSVTLHGTVPSLPAGVLETVRQRGEVRFTWQPEEGVRSAVVAVYENNGTTSNFVVAGRSLREVEMREDHILLITGAALAAGLVGMFVLIVLLLVFAAPELLRLTARERGDE